MSIVCNMLADGSDGTPETTANDTNRSQRLQLRLQAIGEIISSEDKYLKQLNLLICYFAKPLWDQHILDAFTYSILFKQIGMIYILNMEFKTELQDNMENFGTVFYKTAPFF